VAHYYTNTKTSASLLLKIRHATGN